MNHVLVGLSGGLDSAFVAYTLKKEGFLVDGIHFSNGFVKDNAYEILERISKFLDISIKYVSLKEQFSKLLMNVDIEMCHMQSPNICVMCARDIKFGYVMRYALSNGYDYMATGHYVRLMHEEDDTTTILKGIDETRDQSYGFGVIPQHRLIRALTPLGYYIKSDIRKIADDIGLPYINKESRGLCFTTKPFNEFYSDMVHMQFTNGKFITVDKKPVIFPHDGQQLYVRGQKVFVGKTKYVVDKKMQNGDILLTQQHNIYKKSVFLRNIVFHIAIEKIDVEKIYQIKIRYNGQPVNCKILNMCDEERLKHQEIIPFVMTIQCQTPVYAPTPGQIGTIYDGDIVVLGGFIC